MAMLEDAPFDLLDPGRRPAGLAPVLLPFDEHGEPDWDGFAHLLGRAVDSGLTPAVNLGAGAADLLGPSTRAEVLATTGAALGGATFVAGVRAEAGTDGAFDPQRLAGAVDAATRHNAIPALLPSPALAELHPDEALGLLAWMGEWCDRLLAVELPAERWPGGRTWALAEFTALLDQRHCVGVIDGSWSRQSEWDRLRRRDDERPGFRLYSANALGVDQVMYGADHCLDLAAAIPDGLADRDEAWEQVDAGVVERHDALQALATLVFRPPVAASRHSLAVALQVRGWLAHDRIHPDLLRRGPGEADLLRPALERLGLLA
jgi:hypothetical protein